MINFLKSILPDSFKDLLKRGIKFFNNRIHPIKIYKNLNLMLNANSLELLVYPNISSYEKLNEYYWMLTYYLYPIRNKISNIYIQSELKLDKLNFNENLSDELKNFTELKGKFHTINKKSINTRSCNVFLVNDHMRKNSKPYKHLDESQ